MNDLLYSASIAGKCMFYHANVLVANDIKSTEIRWKSTTLPVELHQTLFRRPNDIITKKGGDIAVWPREINVTSYDLLLAYLFTSCILFQDGWPLYCQLCIVWLSIKPPDSLTPLIPEAIGLYMII